MNIIFLGCTQNYGHQFSAANTKVELLAKGLTIKGNNCMINNGITGCKDIAEREELKISGVGTIVTYPLRKYNQVVGYIKNLPDLRHDLKKFADKKEKNILVLLTPYIHIYLLYIILGRMCGYKIVTISHEWLPTIKRKFWIQNLSSKIYSKTFAWGIHGILPISHYIWQRVEHFGKPMLMTPILAEYPNEVLDTKKKQEFVYCVYAFYYRVIAKIIDSYKLYRTISSHPYGLTLVLSGSDSQIKRVQDYIRSLSLQDNIQIRSKLPYAELFSLYQSASSLIIPLDPKSEQDKARFSQKIAEYLSTGTPVISCNVGEIPYYFKDRENIILSDYSIDGFAKTFLWVEENTSQLSAIGYAGFKTGNMCFNYVLFGDKLHNFLTDKI